MNINIEMDNKIIMAFTDPIDTDDPKTCYKYFTENFTGEGVHTYHIFDNEKAFINKWINIHDKPNGMWYWVLDNGNCICSGACDPDDIDIFIEHWHLETYSDRLHKAMIRTKNTFLYEGE